MQMKMSVERRWTHTDRGNRSTGRQAAPFAIATLLNYFILQFLLQEKSNSSLLNRSVKRSCAEMQRCLFWEQHETREYSDWAVWSSN